VGEKPILVSNIFSQRSSHKPLVIPQNSASALESATTFCFLLLYVARFPITIGKYPNVDFLSKMFPAQSESV
jgi:hypothetical protein